MNLDSYWEKWRSTLNLRERVLCLLHISSVANIYIPRASREWTPAQLLIAAAENPEVRQKLSVLPIATKKHEDPEVIDALQDLANIIACETDQAFYADYYPRLPDVDVPEDHVSVVMAAMQRELDREATTRRTRSKPEWTAYQLSELPWERQCALAERRRYWFGEFGITPESWKTGEWSLWEVKDRDIPLEVAQQFNTYRPAPDTGTV